MEKRPAESGEKLSQRSDIDVSVSKSRAARNERGVIAFGASESGNSANKLSSEF